MKKQTRTLYIVHDLDRGYAEYSVYETSRKAKRIASHTKGGERRTVMHNERKRRLAVICEYAMKRIFGKGLAQKNPIKMTVTIEEVK